MLGAGPAVVLTDLEFDAITRAQIEKIDTDHVAMKEEHGDAAGIWVDEAVAVLECLDDARDDDARRGLGRAGPALPGGAH